MDKDAGKDHRKTALRDRLTSGLASLRNGRRLHGPDRQTEAVVLSALEQVVDGTDTRIRLVPAYRKKLWHSIEKSREYIDRLVEQIPGAIEITRNNFVSDPYVNAFFASTLDLRAIYNRSSELRDFFKDIRYRDTAESCVLLCMQKTERTVLGVELCDGQIRKDVRQTTVSFSDHRLYSPAPSEPGARDELRHCIFEGLITNALSRIVELRARRRRLESEWQILSSRLRSLLSPMGKGHGGEHPAPESGVRMDGERKKLVEIESKLKEMGFVTPQVALNQVKFVFDHPEDFIRLHKISMRLDKMGIRIDKASHKAGNTLNLSEITISGQEPRIVALARLKRNEISIPRHTPGAGLARPQRFPGSSPQTG